MAPVTKRKLDDAKSKAPKEGHANKKFKKTTKEDEESNEPVKPIADSKLLAPAKEEVAFPRGGASVLTPIQYKEAVNEAARDVLFETKAGTLGEDESETKKRKRVHKKDKADGKGKKGDADNENAKDNGPKIEVLSYKRLVPGTIVLGCISKITATDIALALPNNLTGFIPITSISDQINAALRQNDKDSDSQAEEETEEATTSISLPELKDMFQIGQFLRASVLNSGLETSDTGRNSKKKHIELSLLPRLVNPSITKQEIVDGAVIQGSVKSIEDQGLIMDLGLDFATGFLGNKEIGLQRSKVREGQVLLCIVTGKASEGQVIKLSADFQKGNKKSNNASQVVVNAPTIDAFLPGTLVEWLVTDVKERGLAGKVMGSIDVTVDLVHLGLKTGQAIEDRFKIGMKLQSRILATFLDGDLRKLTLSLLPHMLVLKELRSKHEQLPLDALPTSSKVDAAKVVRVQGKTGLYLNVGVDGILAFVHISRVSDEKLESLSASSGPYKLDSVHAARIIGYNPADGVYIASMEKKVLEQPVLSIDEIKSGAVMNGTISKVLGHGLLVDLADGISGYVPETQLSDVKLLNPEKKFRVGATVKCRVLSTDSERHRVTLTLKKTLINAEGTIFDAYKDIQIGQQCPGTITKILPSGAVVSFFNNINGFLPVAEMSEAYIKDPREHFQVGQVVRVYATAVDSENEKLKISCKNPQALGAEKVDALKSIDVGTFTSGRVSEQSNDDIVIALGESGLKGILVQGHLSDGSREKNLGLFKRMRAGQTLGDLLILDKNENRKFVTLTIKPSLIKAAKADKLVKSIDQLSVGQSVTGFVKNITTQAIFVEFANRVTGYLPVKALPNEVQSLPDFGYTLFQTVTCFISFVNQTEAKFGLSLKPVETEKKDVTAVTPSSRPTVNPVDGVTQTIEGYKDGLLTKARITSIKETQINMELADNVKARVDVSQFFDSWDNIKNKKLPLIKHGLKLQQIIPVKVIGLHDSKNYKYLPISHRTSGKDFAFELTAKPSEVTSSGVNLPSYQDMAIGTQVIGFVNNVQNDGLWINVSPTVRGRIKTLDVSDDISLLQNIHANFPIGSAIRCVVTHVDAEAGRLDLSARATTTGKTTTLADLSPGMLVPARVTKITETKVIVQISETVNGTVSLADMDDDFTKASIANFEKDNIIRVSILQLGKSGKPVICSTRRSRVLNSSWPVVDKESMDLSNISVGEVKHGFVININNGAYIDLGNNIVAKVKIADMSDNFVKDYASILSIGQLVKGKITAVDTDKEQVSMSLKTGVVKGKNKKPLSNYTEGEFVDAHVRKIVPELGLFLVIDGSDNVSGLCHKSQISDDRKKDALPLYSTGDLVKAKILKVDVEKSRVSFGIKASYFKDLNIDEMDVDEDDEDRVVINGLTEDDDEDDNDDGGVDLNDDEESDSDDEEEDTEDVEQLLSSTKGLSVGFEWNGTNTKDQAAVESSDSEASSDDEKRKKRKKKRNEIKVDHTDDLNHRKPQSADDFERLLLAEPNSSLLWMSYMAYELQLNEVDSARALAERALKTINIREETAKMDVWVALLNLENVYGSEDSLEEVFQRACQYNDSQTMHEKLCSIFIQSGKLKQADTLFQTMVKKFSQSLKVWLNYATFLMDQQNQKGEARLLLPRAMQAIQNTRLHVDLTLKFAQLEFKSGDPEKGRTIFEQLLDAYPKRLDLWNVLLDIEMKQQQKDGAAGDKEVIRRLFPRVVGKLAGRGGDKGAKKARFFFKKWLAFEEKNGDAKSVEKVKKEAAEFVNKVQENKKKKKKEMEEEGEREDEDEDME